MAYLNKFSEQALQAHLDLKGNLLHPLPWVSFDLALHHWSEPLVRLAKPADIHNVQIATPMVGETTVYGKRIPSRRWWE
jgi:hypothetical protein